jgi:hypothetical protein
MILSGSTVVMTRASGLIATLEFNYHTRRADYICSRVLPQGTDLHVVAAHDAEYDTSNWWHSCKGAKIFLHEVGGFIVAAWEVRHNSVRTTASLTGGD